MRDLNVYWGTGLAVGSVIPKEDYSCIRNVEFHNVKLHHPFKGIYVKNNPSSDVNLTEPGQGGIAENILYENI